MEVRYYQQGCPPLILPSKATSKILMISSYIVFCLKFYFGKINQQGFYYFIVIHYFIIIISSCNHGNQISPNVFRSGCIILLTCDVYLENIILRLDRSSNYFDSLRCGNVVSVLSYLTLFAFLKIFSQCSSTRNESISFI